MYKKVINDKFKNPLIYLGIAVFLVCLGACTYHIYHTQNNLENAVNQQLQVQLDVASEVLSRDVDESCNFLDVIAGEMGERRKSSITDSQIYQILAQYKEVDNFTDITYLDENGILYFDGARKMDSSHRVKEGIYDIHEATVYVSNNFWQGRNDYMLLYITPVISGDDYKGYIIGLKSCTEILDETVFSYLKEIGDVMVVDTNGVILDCHFTNVDTVDDHFDTIYDCMTRYWGMGKSSVTELRNMISDMDRKGGDIACESGEGESCFYAYSAVGKMPLRVVVMYTDNFYTQSKNEIIMGSVVFSAITIFSMMLLLFLTIRHNSSSKKLIEKMAYEDAVTGGKNLNFFKEFVAEHLNRYQGMMFLVHRFDIANFRYINEAYGHVKADQLLKIIIEEAGAIFNSKELCVRMNADQFVTFTKNSTDLEERFFVLTDKVNARALDIGIRYPIKFKRGVYQIKSGEYDVPLLIDKANAARRTLTGEEQKSVFYYSEKLVKDMHKVDQIESEMESALFNNEFKMYIQPKWDIREDRLYGGEALVRWIKDDGSMVFPSDFVPVFEKNGFIGQLDMFMLESACKMVRQLLDDGCPPYPISVNQSRMLLNDPDYIGRVTEILERYHIPKGAIELEVTETVLFMERDKMLSVLRSLKAAEVNISMDDFGSGYSSLNMLKDFPFDVLKIDKEFFSESITSDTSVWILRMIFEMAAGLNMRVICEGVETKEQVEMLRKIGCHYVQGYYYSKPIPAEEFVKSFCKESA